MPLQQARGAMWVCRRKSPTFCHRSGYSCV